ncbi:MAG: MBL fold metallo-hydrolase [Chloroflexi bacterium]|nr:MAG: MBL fold metallo-hydrolase [Chloroflexota bacterium]TMB96722.1 MAG: MBL fold metallo-hydrolase [Chloroflexota bacterium]TMC25004.1 MAG: MBL fold metallo-hydrolase [Chloroflexota bacterium]
MIRISASRVPPYDNGMFLVWDERKDAILIDPSMGELIALDLAKMHGLRIVEILNTHGHPDHIAGNAAVKEATRARLAIHRLDEYRLDPTRRPPTQIPVPTAAADDLIEEGPLRYVADIDVVAMHTPGHTEGSTCFYLASEKALFSGDVLFKGNVGRIDLPGGDARAMEKSLARIAELPADTRVYPGHGDLTTIGAELTWLRTFRFT